MVSFHIPEFRHLVQHYNFPNLEEMHRDRLVCSLQDEHQQNRLFAKKQLTFALVQQEALVAEAAAKSRELFGNLKKMTLPRPFATTNQVNREEPAALEQTDRPATE
ncbi:hypothetical protein MRX96_051196 [Rhipicephalus microplus]